MTGDSVDIPICPAGSYLSAKIVFPGCWDGRNLDSADHKSHMAYPVKNACPVSYPVGPPHARHRATVEDRAGHPKRLLSLQRWPVLDACRLLERLEPCRDAVAGRQLPECDA